MVGDLLTTVPEQLREVIVAVVGIGLLVSVFLQEKIKKIKAKQSRLFFINMISK